MLSLRRQTDKWIMVKQYAPDPSMAAHKKHFTKRWENEKRPIPITFPLTLYHTMPHFDALKIYIAVENIVRKGEIAC